MRVKGLPSIIFDKADSLENFCRESNTGVREFDSFLPLREHNLDENELDRSCHQHDAEPNEGGVPQLKGHELK